MIGENGYSCLKEYKALTNLRIVGNNWIDHVNECLLSLTGKVAPALET